MPDTEHTNTDPAEKRNDFSRLAEAPQEGLLKEFWGFLKDNKRWWLIPIVLTLALLGLMLFLGGGPMAPFIYTLF